MHYFAFPWLSLLVFVLGNDAVVIIPLRREKLCLCHFAAPPTLAGDFIMSFRIFKLYQKKTSFAL